MSSEDSSDERSEVDLSAAIRRRRRKLKQRRKRKRQRNSEALRKEKKKEKLIKVSNLPALYVNLDLLFFIISQQILDAEPELDDLDASLVCPVCLDLLFDPYNVVPCKHTFCETCLRRIGSKDPMNTSCPMCRQRIAYCERQSGKIFFSLKIDFRNNILNLSEELALSIKESYSELYKKRKTTEKGTNVYEMPLPWRPGWRNLVSGRALGGNRMGASTLFDYLRTIVQLLPYYIPPVVIANLINMIFFFFLLGAVEVIPFISSLLHRSAKPDLTEKVADVLAIRQSFSQVKNAFFRC